jgi:5-methylcytosine-specific restriction endonuclease McrA
MSDRGKFTDLVAGGASIARIARELGVTRYAVKRRLERDGLRTERARRLDSSRRLRAVGGASIERNCAKHGQAVFARDTNGTLRRTRCSSEAVSKRRREVKAILVREAGGRCALCGYDRCIGALAFHHVDPRSKSFGLAEGGLARSLAKSREEVAKCVLLCANCHAEVEAGLTALPAVAAA